MKSYSTGTWGIGFIFSISGSVFPKSLVWALPDALAAVAVSFASRSNDGRNVLHLDEDDVSRCISLMGGYYALMGFILVFRSQLAYSRWWEGGALLQQLRGEWFNAYSSLLAFCSSNEADRHDVELFQSLLMRLMSILYSSALEQVADLKDKEFEIFDIDGMDVESLKFLNSANDKCEVTLQWIQRLIVEAANRGTIPIAPPILSRVFQEFSRGIVNLNHVRKIAEFPFPFPWPQMITLMLVAEWFITPIMCGTALDSPFWAFLTTFFVTFAFWNIHYIAQELENPFGDDDNDLPLREMQVDMNRSLANLMETRAQVPPGFQPDAVSNRRVVSSSILQELAEDEPGCASQAPRRLVNSSVKRYTSPIHTRQTFMAYKNRSSTQPNLGATLGWLGRDNSGTMSREAQAFTASAPISMPSRHFPAMASSLNLTPQLRSERSLRVTAGALEGLNKGDKDSRDLDREVRPAPPTPSNPVAPSNQSFGVLELLDAGEDSLPIQEEILSKAKENTLDEAGLMPGSILANGMKRSRSAGENKGGPLERLSSAGRKSWLPAAMNTTEQKEEDGNADAETMVEKLHKDHPAGGDGTAYSEEHRPERQRKDGVTARSMSCESFTTAQLAPLEEALGMRPSTATAAVHV